MHKYVLLLATGEVALDTRRRVTPRLSVDMPSMAWRIRTVTALSVLFIATGATFRSGPGF